MRVLAFDQSTRVSGYSVFNEGEYVTSGVIDLSKNKNTEDRSRQMGLAICEKISEYKPDIIVIEEVALQSNADTLKKLARIQGVAIGFAAAHNIPLYIIEPTRWRSKLNYKQGRSVKREELKRQSLDYVKNTFGLELSEDAAEAVCINVVAQQIYDDEI